MKEAAEEKACALLQSARIIDFTIFFDIYSCGINDSFCIFQLLLKRWIEIKIDPDRESFFFRLKKAGLLFWIETFNTCFFVVCK